MFGCTKLTILGHIISGNTISADPHKLSAFQKLAVPTTGKQLESFLGTACYLRDYIPLFSRVAAPLERIRKTKGSLASVWTDECDRAFLTLKKVLCAPPVLSMPDFNREFCVATDASNLGVGAVLYQREGDKIKYICFASSSLSTSQKNYPATKKELLGVVFALKKFRQWLWGAHFTLFTDHVSFVYLFNNSSENLMLSNWADYLLQYNFTIVHCPGVLNILPDYLSRMYPGTNELASGTVKLNMVGEIPKKPVTELKQFIRERFDKEDPGDARQELMQEAHLINHQGSEQLFKKLFDDGYFWNTMKKDCNNLVATCKKCLAFNVAQSGFHPLSPVTAQLPFDHVAIDLFGPLQASIAGYTFGLVLTDIATRFVCLAPLKDKTAESVAGALFPWFCTFGFPKIMQSDNGTEFVNAVVKRLVDKTGIELRKVTPTTLKETVLQKDMLDSPRRLCSSLLLVI